MPGLPQLAFLLSIAGLSVTLAGFAGLVAALKRGAPLKANDAFRLRQIPEMALATGILALLTVALSDTVRDAALTLRIAGGLGLLFVIAHSTVMQYRARAMKLALTPVWVITAVSVDAAALGVGVTVLVLATVGAYEWLLVVMIARPMLAFLLALSDVTTG